MSGNDSFSSDEFVDGCTPAQVRCVRVNAVGFFSSIFFGLLGAAFFALPRCQSRHTSGEDFKDACQVGLGLIGFAAALMTLTLPLVIIACSEGFFSCKRKQDNSEQRQLSLMS